MHGHASFHASLRVAVPFNPLYVQRADVRLNLPDAILITGYQTSSCSHGTARDGSVRAEGHNFEKCNRWLWTSGVETTVPVLKNAALGVYTATPIAENGFEPLKFVSVAPPAQVLSESI